MCRRRRGRRGTDAGQAQLVVRFAARVRQGGPVGGAAGRVNGAVGERGRDDTAEWQDRLGIFRGGVVVVVEPQLVGARKVHHVRGGVILIGG